LKNFTLFSGVNKQQGEIDIQMTKIQKISKNITFFAGVFFANNEFSRSGLHKLVDSQLLGDVSFAAAS